jgi:hypothetical protein
MLISVDGTSKNQLQSIQESMEDAPGLLLCSLLRNPSLKPIRVLEHYQEGEIKFWFLILWGVTT